MNTQSKTDFTQGLRDGVPVGVGYLSVSFSYGVMAVNLGLPAWAAILISLSNLTSAGQYAGVSLISAGAPIVEIALAQLVINIRYSLMSMSLSQKADGTMTAPHRLTTSFVITDEIFALASQRPGMVSRHYMYGVGLIPLISWNLGSLLGAVAGGLMPAALRASLNVALYAMFIAIIIPPARSDRAVLFAVAAAAAGSLLTRYAPILSRLSAGFAMILCAVLAALAAAVLFPVKEAADGGV
ncbi:MAG: AzlC family ABC transporter permease [Clostridiales bacterium]|nr:AzlC family ABC transporter permease [Clostridiales bacterium]